MLLLLFSNNWAGGSSGSVTGYGGKIAPAFKIGVIPVAAYDSDLGFKYGIVANLFDYRQKVSSGKYDQYLFFRVTNATKGSFQIQALLESAILIKNSITLIESGYVTDSKFDFYGFNGNASIYHPGFEEISGNDFLNRFFYAYNRSLIRFRFDNQLIIADNNLRLLTGLMFNNYDISAPPASSAGDVANESALLNQSLFGNYVDWGLIPDNQKYGGKINLLSFGLVYDSRNDLCYCTDGIWGEAVLIYSPGLISDNSFSKFILTYRQHASMKDEKLTFSFRFSSQQKLGGDIPFYMLPLYYDTRMSQDGLGGAYSLRGASRNRIIADGFVMSNTEVKFKVLEFELLRQPFFISTSLFYDNAFVTQTYQIDYHDVPVNAKEIHFGDPSQTLHHSFGAGAYIVFNNDNVITINYGIPLRKHNGPGGLYIGSSLLF